MQEIRADQLALDATECAVRGECSFHGVRARLERRHQMAMAPLKML